MSMNPQSFMHQTAATLNITHVGPQPITVVGPLCQTFIGDRQNPITTNAAHGGITIR